MDNINTLSSLTIDTTLPTPISRIYNKKRKNTHFSFSSVNRNDLIIKNRLLAKRNYNYILEIKSLKLASTQYVNIINELKKNNKSIRNRYSEMVNELHVKNIYLIDRINQYENNSCCFQ